MLKKTLKFLSLLDKSGNLSITNVAAIVLITKMAIAPFDWAIAAGLFVTLLNYSHKRHETNKADKAVKALESQANSDLSAKIDKVQADHEEVVKTLAETRKLLSNTNLAAGFGHRK